MNEKYEVLPHNPQLDGVRGLAVLMVMVMHFYDPVAARSPFGPLTRFIQQGGAGVDLFFVLSGFLITGILVASKEAVNYFQVFYVRRVLRIFPLYVAVVGLFFWVVVPLLQRHGYLEWVQRQEQIWYWLFLANWRHAFGYNDGAQLSHFWSLAIEEQFYFVWSLAVWFATPRQLLSLSTGVLILVVMGRALAVSCGASDELIYFSTVTRLDPLAFGALLAISLRIREFFGRWGWFLLVVCAGLSLLKLPLQIALLLNGTGAAALVGLATTRQVPLLRMEWLRTFGKYSYGLYVLHYLIHGALVAVVNRFGPVEFALFSIAGGIALSFCLAWISWNLLEHPILKLKRHYKYQFL